MPLLPVMVQIPHYRIQMIPTFQLGPEVTCTLGLWMLDEVTKAEERLEHVAKRFDIANVTTNIIAGCQRHAPSSIKEKA